MKFSRTSRHEGQTETWIYQRHIQSCKGGARCHCPWWIRGYINGEKIRESLQTTSTEIAVQRKRQREAGSSAAPSALPVTSPPAGLPASDPPAGTHNPLDALIERFIERQQAYKSITESTTISYRSTLGRFRKYVEFHDALSFEQLTPTLIEDFLLAGKLAPRTRKKYYVNLKTFFKFAHKRSSLKQDLLPEDPPRIPLDGAHRPLSKQEQRQLLAACDRAKPQHRARDRAIILTLLCTGLRSCDVRQLHRNHLDRVKREVRLRMQKTRATRVTDLRIGKLPALLFEALDAVPRSTDLSLPIFTGSKGKLDTQQFADIVGDICRRAGVDASPHDFRVTFAVERLIQGGSASLSDVSKALGHSSTLVTERCYIKWVPDLDKRLDDLMENADFSHLEKAS